MKPQDLTVMIPMEVLVRELDAKLLLALSCLKKNFGKVILGRDWQVRDYMFSGKHPYIYIAKGHFSDPLFYQKIAKSGGKVVTLDEEGGIYARQHEKNYLRGGVNNPCIGEVAHTFFWGDLYLDSFLARQPLLQKKRITVTGHPRFDLCKPEYNDYYKKLSQIKNKPEKYILVNTVWGCGNGFLNIEQEVEKICQNSSPENKENYRRLVSPIYNYELNAFPAFLEGLMLLAKAVGDYKIVIRPHPVENFDTYRNYFAQQSNVMIANSGSVNEWMNNAFVVIHNGCTTGIECYINGNDVISFTPNLIEDMVQYIPHEISRIITDASVLVETVCQKIRNPELLLNPHTVQKTEMISRVIANINFSSAQMIVDLLAQVTEEMNEFTRENITSQTQPTNSFKRMAIKYCPDILKNLLQKFIKGGNNISSLQSQKFPGLSKQELKKRVKIMSEIIGVQEPKINALGRNIFCLERR